jgi:uncharacterized protein (TIGR00730 family)
MKIKNICVFCGARDAVAAEYKELAERCGKLIGALQLTLIYGGTGSGLMGKISNEALASGAEVIGVYPNILGHNEPINPNLKNCIYVDSMYERKKLMIEKADAFVVLPGGAGTLDEAFEIITLKVLKEHNKPIIFINHNGYWDVLNQLFKHLVDNEFAGSYLFDTYRFVATPEEAFAKLGFKI